MMKYDIPGTSGKYQITLSGTIYLTKTNTIDNTLSDAEGRIRIDMYGKDRLLTREWLTNIAAFGIDDPNSFNYVEFYHVKSKWGVHPWNVVFKEPQWFDEEKRYRIVPGFPSVAVDNVGNVVNVRTGELYDIKDRSGNYKYVSVVVPYAKVDRPSLIHRLVALAWVHNPDPSVNFIVNHLDENKENNDYRNLEWTTIKGNVSHSHGHDCRVREIETGKVHTFPSTSAACEYIGMNQIPSYVLATNRANRIYKNKYEIRVAGDDRPWAFDKDSQNIESSRFLIIVKDKDRTLKFHGMRAVIHYYRIWNISKLSRIIKELKRRHPELKVTVIDSSPPREVQVMDVKTGNVKTYSSTSEASKATGVNRGRISTECKMNGRVIATGYRFRWASLMPWCEPLTDYTTKRKTLVAQCRSTSKTFKFKSLREASRKLAMSRNMIQRHVKDPKPKDQYDISYC